MDSFAYIGFTDGASCHTQNSSSATWVIYTPMGQVLSSGGVCLQPSSNNVVEYIVASLSYCVMPFHTVFIFLRYILIHG